MKYVGRSPKTNEYSDPRFLKTDGSLRKILFMRWVITRSIDESRIMIELVIDGWDIPK